MSVILKHPDTGGHVRASDATAARLIEDGWERMYPDPSEKPAKTAKKKPSKPAPDPASDGGDPPVDLSKMKLAELIAYADEHGIDTAEFSKPSTSKAAVIAAIIEAKDESA